MRLLRRDTTLFELHAYDGKQEILDDGRHTGRYEVAYKDPVIMRGNISVPSGYVQDRWFGIETDYTHVLLMHDANVGIHEAARIVWKGDTFEIQAVKPTKTVLAVALKRVKTPKWE